MDEDNSLVLPEVHRYIEKLPAKHQDKVIDFMRLLTENDGALKEPYSKHLQGRLWELRPGLGKLEHRILYSLLPGRRILFITAFLKKTDKTPRAIIDRAIKILKIYQKNKI